VENKAQDLSCKGCKHYSIADIYPSITCLKGNPINATRCEEYEFFGTGIPDLPENEELVSDAILALDKRLDALVIQFAPTPGELINLLWLNGSLI